MDFENNGQSVTNFMHKVKKQAKRLFQLSKSSSNGLQVTSLSKAQEILAQINGYPDWHALEKHISQSKNFLTKESNSQIIELENYGHNNLHFLSSNDSITSILRVNFLNTGTHDLMRAISSFNDRFSFPINMGIHDIGMYFEQKNKIHKKESGYSLYEISKSFNLTPEQAQKFFYIDKSKTTPFVENGLTIYFIITTASKYKEEHMNLCLSMLEDNTYIQLESMPYLEKDHLESLQLNNAIRNEKLESSLLKYPLYDKNDDEAYYLLTKWIYLLNYLSDKKIGFLLKYSLIEKTIEYKFENYENNKELIESLILSAIKTNKFNAQELKYISKPNFNYINETHNKGLSLKSQLDNRIFNYHSSSSIRTSHIDLIYGKPGSGKSVLNNMIALSSIVDKDLNSMPRMAIIDVGHSYKGMINLLKNMLPVELKHTVKQFDIENNENYTINLLDLPLGKRNYEIDDSSRIALTLATLFDKNEELILILRNAIELLNDSPHKLFQLGLDSQIDKFIKSNNFKIQDKTTWWNITDYLFSNGEDQLAWKAQTYATPVLSDLISVLSSQKMREIFGKINTLNNESLIDYIIRNLLTQIEKYSFINSPTKLNLNEVKIAYFNLDKVIDFRIKEIKSYWFSLVLSVVNTKILGFNNYIKNFPHEWKEDWKNYINQENISSVYDYYNYSKFGNNFKVQNKLIIDELHRFSENEYNMEKIHVMVRESRKNYIGISLASQSLKDFNILSSFATALFISPINNEDTSLLKEYGIENNELTIMKNMKFPSWAVKLKTNRGYIFDIFKLEMTPALQLALSSTIEDVEIKNELIKSYNYIEMLEKASDYLSNNNINSFKRYFEMEKEKGQNTAEIINSLINNIKKI